MNKLMSPLMKIEKDQKQTIPSMTIFINGTKNQYPIPKKPTKFSILSNIDQSIIPKLITQADSPKTNHTSKQQEI
jgi:regulatory protein YycH of two-component signal transduction system YycFG